MTYPSPLSTVGRTALGVALARAIESERPDAWFDDPLARGLAAQLQTRRAQSGGELPAVGLGLQQWVSVRTRFLDELVVSATSEGIRQLVIVGAGLDARAFRLGLTAEATVYEFDRADVLEIKQRVLDALGLQPTTGRVVVTGDIMDAGWLDSISAAGWQRSEPTLWILEGFLIYFEAEERVRILTELSRASAPGSRFGATVSNAIERRRHPLWRAFTDLDFVPWFASCGWAAEVANLIETSAVYGREIRDADEVDFPGVLVDARVLEA